ncbi:hypothetical protein GmHk_14G040363 [Glycine max]|nr:hypothetical protein GmHk_14G040363 [Glycine max]
MNMNGDKKKKRRRKKNMNKKCRRKSKTKGCRNRKRKKKAVGRERRRMHVSVKDIFAISPYVQGAPAKMLGAPSNTLRWISALKMFVAFEDVISVAWLFGLPSNNPLSF